MPARPAPISSEPEHAAPSSVLGMVSGRPIAGEPNGMMVPAQDDSMLRDSPTNRLRKKLRNLYCWIRALPTLRLQQYQHTAHDKHAETPASSLEAAFVY